MKIVISAAAIVILMIGAQSAFALTEYQSGLKLGTIDGKHSGSVSIRPYILQPGKGFANQTKEFINGYVTGYCKITGNTSSVDFGQAIFNCMEGPSSADWRIPYHFEVLHSEYMAGYKQAYAEGKHDGLVEGVYHHDKIDNHDRNIRHDIPWFEGYTTGWNRGCVDSGRTQDDCDSQADANTP